MDFSVSGKLVDIETESISPVTVTVADGIISDIRAAQGPVPDQYITPGFVDAHVHVESSMLVPSEFARMAVTHGTVGAVSDPHEIANVCGLAGVEYMIENGKKVPFKFCFGAPSCVPATTFETSGARLGAREVEQLLVQKDIGYLAEVMNFPAVLSGESEIMEKIAIALALGKPVDGHAPGLRGEQAHAYAAAGISTDHECTTAAEALDKLSAGMKILIREGSAARNFDALIPLLHDFPRDIMFCSDDKHPDNLLLGHINQLCARAVAAGVDIFKVLQAACVNPVTHYRLPVGLLKKGDPADFVILQDLTTFRVLKTYINGGIVAENGRTKISSVASEGTPINNFRCHLKETAAFKLPVPTGLLPEKTVPVIEVTDGQLITGRGWWHPLVEGDAYVASPEEDVLKIVVVNRYAEAPVACSFVKNFGLKSGAMASSIAHDSHNIIAVGADDVSLCKAVNSLIECRGGIAVVDGGQRYVLPLPVAGLMSAEDGFSIAHRYSELDRAVKTLGSKLRSPFMTLSFMALLVIPELKISDKGLFDGQTFQLVASV